MFSLFFLMDRRPTRSTLFSSSAALEVYKRPAPGLCPHRFILPCIIYLAVDPNYKHYVNLLMGHGVLNDVVESQLAFVRVYCR